jgi:mannosyltransferase OCH1-like enzyme
MGHSPGENALPIIQYWHSSEVPTDVAELIATFRDLNPALRHLLFHRPEAEEFIAEHLGERELDAFRSCAVPAMQADYFRYCAGLVLGGVSCDADLRCIGSLQPLLADAGGGLLFRRGAILIVSNFFVFAAPDHPLLRLVLDIATHNIESRTMENVWSVTGPWILSALTQFLELGSPDAVRRMVAERGIETSPEPLLEVAGDHGRVAEAFETVQILPFATVRGLIGEPGPVAYKHSDTHWVRWQETKTIFSG